MLPSAQPVCAAAAKGGVARMTPSARVRQGCPAPPVSSLLLLIGSSKVSVGWEGLTLLHSLPFLIHDFIRLRSSLHLPTVLDTKLHCLEAVDSIGALKGTVTVLLIIGIVVPRSGLEVSNLGMVVCK